MSTSIRKLTETPVPATGPLLVTSLLSAITLLALAPETTIAPRRDRRQQASPA
ncbi:MAG TPA: hypothetical protein VKT70_10065 [Stellaceae bacterium]|nr:hypothetical protein [Stellaceae bacterium]